jgi:hypothetical protein
MGTSGLTSGDGKRAAPQALVLAPILDSTGFSWCARPEIIFRVGNESGLHGIILNLRLDAARFPIVAHRVDVGFPGACLPPTRGEVDAAVDP